MRSNFPRRLLLLLASDLLAKLAANMINATPWLLSVCAQRVSMPPVLKMDPHPKRIAVCSMQASYMCMQQAAEWSQADPRKLVQNVARSNIDY